MQNVNINQSLINIVIAFSGFVGGAVALALLYAAYLFIFAGDDPTQEARAKKAIGFALIGAVIAIGAVSLSTTITTNIK